MRSGRPGGMRTRVRVARPRPSCPRATSVDRGSVAQTPDPRPWAAGTVASGMRAVGMRAVGMRAVGTRAVGTRAVGMLPFGACRQPWTAVDAAVLPEASVPGGPETPAPRAVSPSPAAGPRGGVRRPDPAQRLFGRINIQIGLSCQGEKLGPGIYCSGGEKGLENAGILVIL